MQLPRGRALLGCLHRPDIQPACRAHAGKHERSDRIQIQRNAGDEHGYGIRHPQTCEQAQDVRAPRVERNQDADGGGGRIDQIGELLAGDAEPIEQRTADRPGDQNGDVGLDEDHDADHPGEDLGSSPVGHPLPPLHPLHEPANAAVRLDEGDERADREGEQQDASVAGIDHRVDDRVDRRGSADERVPVGEDRPAQPDTGGQGQVDLAGLDRQPDRHQGRQKRQRSEVDSGLPSVRRGDARRDSPGPKKRPRPDSVKSLSWLPAQPGCRLIVGIPTRCDRRTSATADRPPG